MKPILTLAIAAAMAFAGQPLYAAHGRGGHGQPHMQRGHAAMARPQIARQAPKRSAPRAMARTRSSAIASQARVRAQRNVARAAQRNAIASQQRARSRATVAARQRAGAVAQQRANRNRIVAQQRANNRANLAARNRTRIANRNGNRNSIAFGGRTRVNNRVNVRNLSYYHPPVEVYRDWDRGREHTWHHHRYHWNDGAWVVFDLGPEYYYDTTPTVVLDTGFGSDVVAQVQSALDRRGYDAGPVDGVAGGQTHDAIAAFQDDHGLAVTGRINGSLLRSLDL